MAQIKNSISGDISSLAAGIEQLAKMAIWEHYYCDDAWYSCPKAEGGSTDDNKGDKCDCGADKHNVEVNALRVKLLNMMTSNAELG